MNIRETTFSAVCPDGQTVRGRLFLPYNTGSHPLVILAHGYGSCWAELAHYGRWFAEKGVACLLFDFRGGGVGSSSDGTPDALTLGTELEDMEAVLSFAPMLPEIDPSRIFLMGESLGGLVAALTAAQHPEIAGLALWYPALTAPKLAEHFTPGGEEWGMPFPEKFLSSLKRRDTLSPLPRCRMPVLLLHGDEDATVPLEVSRQAVDIFPNASLVVLPGAGHGFEGVDRLDAFARTVGFVQRLFR